MKKLMYSILFLIFIVGCKNKKDTNQTVQLSDSLTVYFAKASDISLSRETRITFNQKALRLLLVQKQDSLFFKNMTAIADHFYDIREMEDYKRVTLLIAQKATQTKDSAIIAKANNYLGDYYKIKSIPDSAYLFYTKAEKIYKRLNNRENLGKTYLNKALLFYEQGDYLRTHIAIFDALTYILESKNSNELYKVYNLIGAVYYEVKEYEEAIKYYNKALNSIQNTAIKNKHLFTAVSLNNLGVAYQSQNKDKEALPYFHKALQEKGLYKDRPLLYAMLQDNLAYSQFKLKQYQELPDLFYKALAIRDSLQIIPGIVMNKLHLSEYYQDQKDNHKAIQFAQEAYTIAKEKGIDPRDILLALKQLKVVNRSEAIVYSEEYTAISDSLRRTEPILPDKMIDAANEAKELALVKADLKERNKNRIIVFSSIIFILIVLFIFSYRKAKNKALKFKERERIANEKIYDLMLFQEKILQEDTLKEKKRIAKELENDVSNLLFDLRNELYDLNTKSDIAAIHDRFFYLYELQKAEKNIQIISKDLIDKKEANTNFIAIVKTLVAKQQDTLNVSFYISETLRWEKVNNFTKINIYLILEAYFRYINNYVQAKNATIRIVLKKGTIVHITLSDDAKGFGIEKKLKGAAVLDMQYRAEKMGGTFTITYSDSGIKIEIIADTHKNGLTISAQNII